MKHGLSWLPAVFLLVMSSQQLIAQRSSTQSSAGPGREVYGSVNGNIYTNKVIGIKLAVPKELKISDPHYVDLKLVTSQATGSMFGGQPLIVKNLLNASIPLTTFIVTATKLPSSAANVTGEQILKDPLFRGSTAPAVKTEKLGNNNFAYVDSSSRFVQQRAYAIVRRGYYISIVLGYRSAGDLNVMREYLAIADFDWKGN